MKINVFSGARRLAFLAGLIGVVVTAVAVFQERPNIQYNYRVPGFGTKYVKSDECDFSTDGIKRLDYGNVDGSKFSVRLCFAASQADNGKMLIPYQEKDGVYLMNGPYSDEVRQHMDLFTKYFFVLDEKEFDKARKEYSSEKIWIKLRGIGYIFLGLIAYVIVLSSIGWVVRGFMGIRSGHDYRTDPE